MLSFVSNWLTNAGAGADAAAILGKVVILAVIISAAFLTYFAAKLFLVRGTRVLALKTKNKWDDFLVERKVANKLANLAPALTVYFAVPAVFGADTRLSAFIVSLSLIHMSVFAVLFINSLLNSALDIYLTFSVSQKIPAQGFIQVAKILLYFTGLILIISVIFDKTPFYLLSGLGVFSAVIMLIFKDAVLGFGAGINLILNKMAVQGDWIEMPKHDADGEVMEVSLTTVKVRNWDKTISNIPAYALVSDSFKNWRGMMESGGRRIKRAIHIDMNSVKFCDSEELRRFFELPRLREYAEVRTGIHISRSKSDAEKEISAIIKELFFDSREPVTNLGLFRLYTAAHLKTHPLINQEMTFLVRQLPPGRHGLPVEIYVFCNDIVWANYETIQAEIFETLLAALPALDLKVFQNPSGEDLRNATSFG